MRKEILIVLSAPEAVADWADVLGGDEGFRVDIIDHGTHPLNVLAQHADGEHGYHAVLTTRRDLGNGVAFSPQAFSNGRSAARTDDPYVGMPHRQTFLDYHAYYVACGKSSRITDYVQGIIQVT